MDYQALAKTVLLVLAVVLAVALFLAINSVAPAVTNIILVIAIVWQVIRLYDDLKED